MPTHKARLAVFISGSGRTLANLIERCESRDLPAEIALVVASRDCKGVAIAHHAGIPCETIKRPLTPDELVALVERHRIDWVVLAGYLRLLPVPPELDRRIVNIHPALLPDFGGPGMHGRFVHNAVLDAFHRGELTETGCTVHLCDATYDTGPVVLQARCPVLEGDDPNTLAARVFELELEAYPRALKMLIEGNAQGRTHEQP
ncbi:MAG: phosphoribosylglycinamide formyltransferase [Phycisphaerales bacterium JB040]